MENSSEHLRAEERGAIMGDESVHLLLSSNKPEGPGNLMRALGQGYVQYINRSYRRSGTLWEGRYPA